MGTHDGLLPSLAYWSAYAKDAMSSKTNVIHTMPWEHSLAAPLDLTISELRFALSFLLAVPAGAGIRLVSSPTLRHLYSLITGFLLVYYPFGSGVLQVLPPAILTYMAMLTIPKRCGALAWAINFPYLIWLHVINASGMSWNRGEIDFTGSDMTLVLKLISLAVCYQDSWRKMELSSYQESHKITRVPNPLEYFSYLLSMGNLLSGPFFEYKDYKDFIEHKGVWSRTADLKAPSPWWHGFSLYLQALVFMVAYVYLEGSWGIDAFALHKTTWYKQQPLTLRLLSGCACGFIYQLKYYYAWKLSEASLTFAGLNFLKWSDDGKPVWGRCCNVRFIPLITADSARKIPLNWNVATGNFLRRYVYERITPKNKKPGFLQLLTTQVVSAIWHGLYPGYLMFFVMTAFFMSASTTVYKAEQLLLPKFLHESWPWWLIKVAWTQLTLDHIVLPFIILEWKKSLHVWADVHFVLHIVILVFIALGTVLPSAKKIRPAGEPKGSSQSIDSKRPPELKAAGVPAFKTE